MFIIVQPIIILQLIIKTKKIVMRMLLYIQLLYNTIFFFNFFQNYQ